MNKLPYWGSWNTGEFQRWDGEDRGYSPDWQLPRIQAGDHIVPTFELITDSLPVNVRSVRSPHYYEPMWSYVKEHNLPLTFVGRNFEGMFARLEPWVSMGPELFTSRPDGSVTNKVSAWVNNFDHWYDLGFRLGEYLQVEYANDYSNPPYVYLGNNNEAGIPKYEEYSVDPLRQTSVEGEVTVDKYVLQREFWKQMSLRRQHFMRGLNDGCPSWSGRMHIFAYTGFGGQFSESEGKPEDLGRYRIPWGGSDGQLEFEGQNVTANIGYIHSWSTHSPYKVRSPQVEASNSRWALDQKLNSDPEFQLETHFWNGQNHEAEVWKGVVRCVLWTMRTEKNRLFLGSNQTVADTYENHMLPLIESCEEVHRNPILADFWQNSTLLHNRWERDFNVMPLLPWEAKDPEKRAVKGYGHPYYWSKAVPWYSDPGDRWFLQNASANERLVLIQHPSGPQFNQYRDMWQSDRAHQSVIKVFALCFQSGDDYLIFASSPIGPQEDVTIDICPDGPMPRFSVTVDTSVSGDFWTYKNDTLSKVLLEQEYAE